MKQNEFLHQYSHNIGQDFSKSKVAQIMNEFSNMSENEQNEVIKALSIRYINGISLNLQENSMANNVLSEINGLNCKERQTVLKGIHETYIKGDWLEL